jgi:hypothetical protein
MIDLFHRLWVCRRALARHVTRRLRTAARWHWPFACHAACPTCGAPLPLPTNADRWELTQVQESVPDARGLWQRCRACGWGGVIDA